MKEFEKVDLSRLPWEPSPELLKVRAEWDREHALIYKEMSARGVTVWPDREEIKRSYVECLKAETTICWDTDKYCLYRAEGVCTTPDTAPICKEAVSHNIPIYR